MKPKTSLIFLVCLCALAVLIAGALLLWVTANGIGVSPDSITYIETAESILAGRGFYIGEKPVTHYPPVYPLFLAVSGSITRDITASAQWLHLALFGINTILFGLAIYMSTRHNLLAAALGMLLFLFTPAILSIHARAWSESPFLMFLFITYLVFRAYLLRQKWYLLIISAIAMGLTVATRYVGVALIPTVLICIFLFQEKRLVLKIRDAILTLVISSLPILAWSVRNGVVENTTADRGLRYHPFGFEKLVNLVDTLHNYALTNFEEGWFNAVELFVIIAILAFLVFKVFREDRKSAGTELHQRFNLAFGFLFSFIYILVVLNSITFIDAHTPLDERILLPVFIFFTISAFSTVFQYSKVKNRQWAWIVFIACILLAIRNDLSLFTSKVNKLHTSGKGFNSVAWNTSPILASLRTFPPDVVVYSNGDDVIRYKTGRWAEALPTKYSPTTTAVNDNYSVQMSSVCANVENEKAIVVFLNEIDREYYPSQDEVLSACSLPQINKSSDGSIYGFLIP